MKKVKFYVLYDYNDLPYLYFESLREFCEKLNYSYDYILHRFSNIDFITLNISGKRFSLHKFEDRW